MATRRKSHADFSELVEGFTSVQDYLLIVSNLQKHSRLWSTRVVPRRVCRGKPRLYRWALVVECWLPVLYAAASHGSTGGRWLRGGVVGAPWKVQIGDKSSKCGLKNHF